MPKINTLHALKQQNTVILVVILLLAAIVFVGLQTIFTGLLGAVIIYVLFRPLNRYLQEKRKWNPSFVSACILILSFLCIILPFLALIKMIADRFIYFVNNPADLQAILDKVNTFASEKLHAANLSDQLTSYLQSAAGNIATSVVNGAANTFVQLLVMYFTLFFILREFRGFEKNVSKYLPFTAANINILGHEIRQLTYSNILGQGFIAIVQGMVLAIGFLIFGIPDAFFWGTVAIFLCMIPMLGSPMVFMPAGIIELSEGHPVAGYGIILYGYLIVAMIDNIIRMIFGRKIAHVHPLITIIGVVIGFPLFGIVGLLYGPLLLATLFILLDIYRTNRSRIAKLEENNAVKEKA